MLVDINFKGKKALVIGCGKVGSKKARKLHQAGFNVTCMSETFDEKIQKFDIELVQQRYDDQVDLTQYDLIYACSDDETLNMAIVDKANELGLLTASSSGKANSNFKLVRSRMLDNNIEAAVFSNGKYLFLPKALLGDLKQIYNQKYANRMGMLANLRKYVKTLDLTSEEKHYILDDLMQAPLRELKFYSAAIEGQPVKLMLLHGSDNKAVVDEVMNTMAGLDAHIYACFIKKEVNDSTIFKASRILQLDHMLKNLQLLNIQDVAYLPMLVEQGYFYRQISNKVNLQPLPIDANRLVKMLEPYRDQHLIILLHGIKGESSIQKMCKTLDQKIDFLMIYDDDNTNQQVQSDFVKTLNQETTYTVFPFFMLNGNHLTNDVMAFIMYCENHGIKVQYHNESLINNEHILKYVKEV